MALATALALAACSPGDDGSTSPASGAPPGGDSIAELRIATPSLPTSFSSEAGGGSGLEFQEFLKLNNATLLRNPYVKNDNGDWVQDTYNFEGYLAESWEESPDGLTLTFNLRRGVLSPAGNEFDADDVLYTLERRWNSPTSSPSANFPILTDPAAQVKKIDQYTVTFTLHRPSDKFTMLTLLSNITQYMYDSDLLRQNETPADRYAIAWSKTNANHGYGPYVLEAFLPDQQMVMVANPNHPLGEAAIKKLTFQLIADPGSRANALRNGDVDIASALRPSDQVELAEESDLQVYSFDTNSFLLWTFITTKPPFDNKLVRQALAWSVPYDQIVESVYAGTRAQRSVGLLSPWAPGYDGANLPEYDFDPDRAKELLAEAGYPGGVDFTITVSNAVPDVQEAAVLVQSYAKDGGFNIEIEELPPAAFAAARNTQTWDAFMWRDYAITLSPPYELPLFFKQEPFPSATGWRPPRFYEILERGAQAGDPLGEEAGHIWNEAQRMILDELPMLFMLRLQPLNAFRAGVEGFAWRSDNLIDYFPLSATEA